MAKPTFDDLLRRNEEYAKSAELPFFISDPPPGFEIPKILIFACLDSRFDVEQVLGLNKYEAFIMRTAGGNVQPYLSDVMFMDKLLGWDMKELIVIHHQDCGATILTEAGIKSDLKAMAPGHEAEIDALEYHMHNGNDLDESVKRDMKFLRDSPLVRPELKKHIRGFVFSFETNRLTEVSV